MCAEYQFYVKHIGTTDERHEIQAIMNQARLIGHMRQDGEWFVVHIVAEDTEDTVPKCLCTLTPRARLAITQILDILAQHGRVYVWPDSFEPDPESPEEADCVQTITDLDQLDEIGMSYNWFEIALGG